MSESLPASSPQMDPMDKRALVVLGIGFITLLFITIITNWYALGPNGSRGLIGYDFMLFFLVMMLGLPGLILGVAAGFSNSARVPATVIVVVCISSIIMAYSAFAFNSMVRMRAFADLADRSMPLVGAIKKYERERGQPPQALEQLVPDYVSQVPKTGMGAYPDYRYRVGRAEDDFPWVLYVPCGRGIGFDQFIYLPDEQYPEEGWGGRLERVGRWAYVHE